ncbi:hypothetical protein AAFX60_017080 [Aliivibrio fischeri]
MSFIGIFCLMMEIWLLKGFPVIKDSPVTFEDLQIILAFTYLSVFVLWARFAFIKPPRFGRRNAEKYVGYVGNIFISRNADSISVMLDEILYSIKEVVELASEIDKQNIKIEEKYANTLIALISDKLICRIMLDKHPILFSKIYELANEKEKFNMDLGLLSMNFITCALDNRESFIYRESNEFSSSYFSIFKPICSGIYDNYKIVNNYSFLLTPDINDADQDYEKWRAYLFLLNMSIKAFLESSDVDESTSFLHWPKFTVQSIFHSLKYIDSSNELNYRHDSFKTMQELSNFFNSTSKLTCAINVNGVSKRYVDDFLSCLLFEAITYASNISSDYKVRKFIQKRIVWDELYRTSGFIRDEDCIVLSKVNNLIYDKIKEIEKNPNVDSVEMLVYILFVLGLEPVSEGVYGKSWRALHIKVLNWCENKLSSILDRYPNIVLECFPENITYHSEIQELRFSYGNKYDPVCFKLTKGPDSET